MQASFEVVERVSKLLFPDVDLLENENHSQSRRTLVVGRRYKRSVLAKCILKLGEHPFISGSLHHIRKRCPSISKNVSDDHHIVIALTPGARRECKCGQGPAR